MIGSPKKILNNIDERDGGGYRLTVILRKPAAICVGALGEFDFEAGKYVYSGSALKSIKRRIARHIDVSIKKMNTQYKKRWHIDYLLSNENAVVESVEVFTSSKRIECELNAEILARPGAIVPVAGFGSSDCSVCPAHLAKIL